MGYSDYLTQYAPSNLQAAATGYARRQQGNPLMDILKAVVGGGIGFATGGPMGAVLGAGSALGTSSDPNIAGLAQAGMGGYQMGAQIGGATRAKAAFQKIASQKGLSPQVANLFNLAQENPELQKDIMSQYVKAQFPTKRQPDALTLLLLASNPTLLKLYNDMSTGVVDLGDMNLD